DLDAHQIPMLYVYNKKDLLKEDFFPSNFPYILISAYMEDDLDRILEKIEAVLKEEWVPYHIELRADQGKVLHQLERETIVTHKEFDEKNNQYVMEGYIQEEHRLSKIIKEQ